MIILSDTREQLELDFTGLEGVEKVEKLGLAFGDYTALIHDKPVPIVFDRKALGDLFGTMTHGYTRWKGVMRKAKDANFKLILIVEGSYSQVLAGYEHSEYSGESMIKKLHMLQVRYDLETVFTENRRVMARYIVGLFGAVERNWDR